MVGDALTRSGLTFGSVVAYIIMAQRVLSRCSIIFVHIFSFQQLHSINSDSESEVEILEPEDSIFIGDIDAFETLIRKKILLMKHDFYINGDLL
jgi:hypothetical protein